MAWTKTITAHRNELEKSSDDHESLGGAEMARLQTALGPGRIWRR